MKREHRCLASIGGCAVESPASQLNCDVSGHEIMHGAVRVSGLFVIEAGLRKRSHDSVGGIVGTGCFQRCLPMGFQNEGMLHQKVM